MGRPAAEHMSGLRHQSGGAWRWPGAGEGYNGDGVDKGVREKLTSQGRGGVNGGRSGAGHGRRLGLRGGDANAGRRAALARAVRHEQSEDVPFIFIEKRGVTLCSTELRIQRGGHWVMSLPFRRRRRIQNANAGWRAALASAVRSTARAKRGFSFHIWGPGPRAGGLLEGLLLFQLTMDYQLTCLRPPPP